MVKVNKRCPPTLYEVELLPPVYSEDLPRTEDVSTI